jgi:hypothetical protein
MATNYGSISTGTVPKRRGRQKGFKGNNQYTGVRAQNIDYVRRILKYFLNAEQAQAHPLSRHILSACKLLLICENVYSLPKRQKVNEALSKLGEDIKDGQYSLPDLLNEVSVIENDTDIEGGEDASV